MATERLVPGWMMSVSPPLFLTGMADDYLGFAPAFGRRFGNIDAGFIVFPTWSIEKPGIPEGIRRAYLEHAAEYPRHVIRFICNSKRETGLLLAQGLPAELLNKNFTVSDSTFCPVDDVPVEFDALYNAQFSRTKRHELAGLVPRVAYVTYVRDSSFIPEFSQLYHAAIVRNPEHRLINELLDGAPLTMSREEISKASARAAVGLLLSAVEGSSYASMEYMLAGLPIVSTPSLGGRDVYFDPDYCIVCDPNSAAVRDAVAELRSRNLSRNDVRTRTLAKIGPARQRFLSLADEVLADLDASPKFAGLDWPYRHWSGVPWRRYDAHFDDFAAHSARHTSS